MAKSGKHSCKQAGVFTPVGSSSRSSARENKAGDERTSDAPNETLVVPNQKPIITREKNPPGSPRPFDVYGAKSEKMVASLDRPTFISISVCFDTCGTTGKFTVKFLLPPNYTASAPDSLARR